LRLEERKAHPPPDRKAATLRATMYNPHVSDEAKEKAREKLEQRLVHVEDSDPRLKGRMPSCLYFFVFVLAVTLTHAFQREKMRI
jgi:hypothetical protein